MTPEPLTRAQVFWALDRYYAWRRFWYETHGREPNVIDMTKSCLLTWMLMGNDPLPLPPPVMHSAPNHEMIVKGELLGVECCTEPHEFEGFTWFCGHPWKAVEGGYRRVWIEPKTFARHVIDDELWTITKRQVEAQGVFGGSRKTWVDEALDYRRV